MFITYVSKSKVLFARNVEWLADSPSAWSGRMKKQQIVHKPRHRLTSSASAQRAAPSRPSRGLSLWWDCHLSTFPSLRLALWVHYKYQESHTWYSFWDEDLLVPQLLAMMHCFVCAMCTWWNCGKKSIFENSLCLDWWNTEHFFRVSSKFLKYQMNI